LSATLGITKYAANALGDVVYVELPELSIPVKAGDSIGAVESVKSASDIMTPVSGNVVERNELLDDKAKLLGEDPEGEGWFARIEVEEESVTAETADLMDEAGYKQFTEEAASS
jgi:glycine cleavage system H protein